MSNHVNAGIMIILITLLILASTVSNATEVSTPKTYVRIDPAPDGVYLSARILWALQSAKSTNAVIGLGINCLTKYIPASNNYTVIIKSVMKGESKNITTKEMMLRSISVKGTGESFEGIENVTVMIATVLVNGTINIEFKGNSTVVSNDVRDINIVINASVDKGLIPKEFLTYIPMLSMMLNPEYVNEQLRSQGIEGMNFSKLVFSYKPTDESMLFYIDASLRINITKYFKSMGVEPETLSNISNDLRELIKISRKVRTKYGFSLNLNMLSPSVFVMESSLKLNINGGVESYLRSLTKYLVKSLEASLQMSKKATMETLKTPYSSVGYEDFKTIEEMHKYLKPWLSITLLPSNSSASMSLSIKDNELKLEVDVRNIRLGHLELRGEGATKEVARLLLSAIKGLIESGVPIKYECSVPNVEADPKIAGNVKLIMGALKVKPYTEVTATIAPPPTEAITHTVTITKTVTKTVTTTIYETETLVTTSVKYLTTTMYRVEKVLSMDIVAVIAAAIVIAGLVVALAMRKSK